MVRDEGKARRLGTESGTTVELRNRGEGSLRQWVQLVDVLTAPMVSRGGKTPLKSQRGNKCNKNNSVHFKTNGKKIR